MKKYSFLSTSQIYARRILKTISTLLVVCFLSQQVSFAAPDLKPLAWSAKTNHTLWARKKLSYIPESTAIIGDAYKAPGSSKTIYLVQDAHTNTSGQRNIAQTLELILQNEPLKYVFLEAASGDESLSFLKPFAPLEKRQDVADSFLRNGKMQGTEYLSLTSNHDFVLWGVEDLSLYAKSVTLYRDVVKVREKFEDYLDRVDVTLKTLKPRIYNTELLAFDKKYQDFKKENISLTDYFDVLARVAITHDIALEKFPHLKAFKRLKELESGIDFKQANIEQNLAVSKLSQAGQKELLLASQEDKASKLSNPDNKVGRAFFALLKEKLFKDSSQYPELFKYMEYLNRAKEIQAKELLDEQKALEKKVFATLSENREEAFLIRASENLERLKKLLKLTMTPDEYLDYQADRKSFGITQITGFLNKKIMDFKSDYDKAVFLENGYDDAVKKCETFYELTYRRNQRFLQNTLRKMTEKNQNQAVLVTGGYHTPDLEYLLKKQNISYIVLTPQILHETNQKRYEEILLGRFAEVTGNIAFSDVFSHRQAASFQDTVAILPTPGVRLATSLGIPASPVFAARLAYTRAGLSGRHTTSPDLPKALEGGARMDLVKDRWTLRRVFVGVTSNFFHFIGQALLFFGIIVAIGSSFFLISAVWKESDVVTRSEDAAEPGNPILKEAEISLALAVKKGDPEGIRSALTVFKSLNTVNRGKGVFDKKIRFYETVANVGSKALSKSDIKKWIETWRLVQRGEVHIADGFFNVPGTIGSLISNPGNPEGVKKVFATILVTRYLSHANFLRDSKDVSDEVRFYLMNATPHDVYDIYVNEGDPFIALVNSENGQLIYVFDNTGRPLFSEIPGLFDSITLDRANKDPDVRRVGGGSGARMATSLAGYKRDGNSFSLRRVIFLLLPLVVLCVSPFLIFELFFDKTVHPVYNPQISLKAAVDDPNAPENEFVRYLSYQGGTNVLSVDNQKLVNLFFHSSGWSKKEINQAIIEVYQKNGNVLRDSEIKKQLISWVTKYVSKHIESESGLGLDAEGWLAVVKILESEPDQIRPDVDAFLVSYAIGNLLHETGKSPDGIVQTVYVDTPRRDEVLRQVNSLIDKLFSSVHLFRIASPRPSQALLYEHVVTAIHLLQKINGTPADSGLSERIHDLLNQIARAINSQGARLAGPNLTNIFRLVAGIAVLLTVIAIFLGGAHSQPHQNQAGLNSGQAVSPVPDEGSVDLVDLTGRSREHNQKQDLMRKARIALAKGLYKDSIEFWRRYLEVSKGLDREAENKITTLGFFETISKKSELNREEIERLSGIFSHGKRVQESVRDICLNFADEKGFAEMAKIIREADLDGAHALYEPDLGAYFFKDPNVSGTAGYIFFISTETGDGSPAVAVIAVNKPSGARLTLSSLDRQFLSLVGARISKGAPKRLALMDKDFRAERIFTLETEGDVLIVAQDGRQIRLDVSSGTMRALTGAQKIPAAQLRRDITDAVLRLYEANSVARNTGAAPVARVVVVSPGLSQVSLEELIIQFNSTLHSGSQVIFVSENPATSLAAARLAAALHVSRASQFVAMSLDGLRNLRMPATYLLTGGVNVLGWAKRMFGSDNAYFTFEPAKKGLMGIYAIGLLGVLMDTVSLGDYQQAALLYSQVCGRSIGADEIRSLLHTVFSIRPLMSVLAQEAARIYASARALQGSA